MSSCKQCMNTRPRSITWDSEFCTLECKCAWHVNRVKVLESAIVSAKEEKLRGNSFGDGWVGCLHHIDMELEK